MVHLQLAPSDSQHKVCASTWADELTAAVGYYPLAPATAGGCSFLATHASTFTTSSRQHCGCWGCGMGFSSNLPALCVTSSFGLWSALHPVFLCLCLSLILACLCFLLLPFIQVGKFLLLLLHKAWLPAEMLRALESFPAFSPDVPGAIAIPCHSEEWSEGKLLLSYLCPVFGAELHWAGTCSMKKGSSVYFSAFLWKAVDKQWLSKASDLAKHFHNQDKLSLDLQTTFLLIFVTPLVRGISWFATKWLYAFVSTVRKYFFQNTSLR